MLLISKKKMGSTFIISLIIGITISVIIIIMIHSSSNNNHFFNNKAKQELKEWKNSVNLVSMMGQPIDNLDTISTNFDFFVNHSNKYSQKFSTVSQNRSFKSNNNIDIIQPVRTIVGPSDISNIYVSTGEIIRSINFTTNNYPLFTPITFKGFEVRISPYENGIDPNNDSLYYYLSFKFNKKGVNYIGDNSTYWDSNKYSLKNESSHLPKDLVDIRNAISTFFPDVYVINALPGIVNDSYYSCLSIYKDIQKCEMGNEFSSTDSIESEDGIVYSLATKYDSKKIDLSTFTALFEYLCIFFLTDDLSSNKTSSRKGTLIMLLRDYDQELGDNTNTSIFCNELSPTCSNCCTNNEPPYMADLCSQNDTNPTCYKVGKGVYYIIAAASVKLPKDFKYKLSNFKYWQFLNLDDENSIIFNNILAM